ncbi:hypothetical protein HYFRA_00011598 [Hymenoscyphus fraxineus]|uniref:Uncharacterized protein n=1 Tax=Hymenoscyphus fraxineus TaxID=746836 RepID=A0A9N9L3E5_9HELO|nr:hypothetical protein HYFRA_00011598 [Hymenoscyphus fraxineus]
MASVQFASIVQSSSLPARCRIIESKVKKERKLKQNKTHGSQGKEGNKASQAKEKKYNKPEELQVSQGEKGGLKAIIKALKPHAIKSTAEKYRDWQGESTKETNFE